jgi:adenosyl cobinamide kinase/adenosyl cobinamide phosphate guanylyltransferase
MGFVLLLGGARSGKSDLACQLAAESGRDVSVVATATPGDLEMAARIERHRGSRPAHWQTIEEPVDLAGAVASCDLQRFLIVDCLTLWVSNLLGDGHSPDDVIDRAASLANELAGRNAVVVSNEVGLGIVPANEMAREYRDTLGAVNARFAARAERALLMVAGRALDLVMPH